ncbi:uncharacterized protein Bfra_010439 [Botrytis fragariae]|uniref:Uncharacterized protein n=1 Tax=Botrytis fragariae TaxID=1964551 RepID=A0A8H6ED54_9HELO|nr:uncharacterized protein Bfra_010439 [Botrytis fragariae]KAF5867465.1 hypothetical protein Bfra_010439 [Botrytis fragariae]
MGKSYKSWELTSVLVAGTSTFEPGFDTMFAEPGDSLITSAAASAVTPLSASSTSRSSTTPQTSQTRTTASTPFLSATNTPVAAASSSTPTIVGAAVGISLDLAVIVALYFSIANAKGARNYRLKNLGSIN